MEKGGKITITRFPEADLNTQPRTDISVSTHKAVYNNVRLGIGLGTTCKSTIPILSEGIGIPKVCEIQLLGRTKFEGSFTSDCLTLESKGITNPHIKTRKQAMQSFLNGITGIRKNNIASVTCDEKNFNVDIGAALDYCYSSSATKNTLRR